MRAPSRILLAAFLAAALALPGSAQEPRRDLLPELREPTGRGRERAARHALQNSRGLRREGRFALAAAAAERGLSFAPEDPVLHRELALSLEALGRGEDAARARATADALAPPPPPPPDEPLAVPSRDLLILLLPPPPKVEASRRPRSWPDGVAAAELEARLHVRLPQAKVVHASFDTVAEARRWLTSDRARAVLSLRVDRLYCGDSVKDGRFGMAWLRAAAEPSAAEGVGPVWGRSVVDDPRLRGGCEREVIARALETVLALPAVSNAITSSSGPDAWSTAAVRTLFPQLGAAIDAHLAEGHELLARGRLEAALERFEQAAEVDPDDPIVRSYRREAEATLAMSRELARRRGQGPDGALEPRLNAAQLAALESSLTEERRLRQELLATLAVLEDDAKLPPTGTLTLLRPVKITSPKAFGPSLARQRAGGSVVARAAYAPDGSEIARYYFPEGDSLPVLREEDLTRDGVPDRWIAYQGNARTEIWEAGGSAGRPDVRMVFTAAGQRLLRVELDRDRDGRPERVFHYSDGAVTAEARDTDRDGRLDTFDRLGPDGKLVVREEDRNGDGEIDVRSHYEDGQLRRREL